MTSTSGRWDEFVRRAKEYVGSERPEDSSRLKSQEIDYKLEISRKLAEAREAVLGDDDGWANLLRSVLKPTVGFPVDWRALFDLNQWCVEHSDEALKALQAMWARDDSSVSERVRAFSRLLPRSVISGAGTRTTVASVLLMGLDVQQYPPFKITEFNKAYERTGYGGPERGADEAALYEHALGFLDQFIKEARERGLPLRDHLDAQSVVWGIKDEPPESDENPEAGDDSPQPEPDLHALANDLHLTPEFLHEIDILLADKRQIIFQGPPGTGKTYVAQKLAKHLAGSEGRVTLVQLHPSYAYEDFVQGFRPALKDGQARFELRDGPLLRAAELAREERHTKHFLVIDEINRGNIAKVFGELYFLLEYRDENIRLQYQREDEEDFSLPPNLYIIGTMNTADRSIALVDLALRRRFYFFGFFPDEPPIKGLLERWLDNNNPEMKWVARLVNLANRKLEDRHLGIGPSHFMKEAPPLDEKRVRFIWEQAVIPYIEEQCFGEENKLKEFAFDQLKQELDGAAPEPDAGNGQPEGGTDENNRQPEDGGDVSA